MIKCDVHQSIDYNHLFPEQKEKAKNREKKKQKKQNIIRKHHCTIKDHHIDTHRIASGNERIRKAFIFRHRFASVASTDSAFINELKTPVHPVDLCSCQRQS